MKRLQVVGNPNRDRTVLLGYEQSPPLPQAFPSALYLHVLFCSLLTPEFALILMSQQCWSVGESSTGDMPLVLEANYVGGHIYVSSANKVTLIDDYFLG